jgi:methylphosphotriester-DNA--protein-cysteine methyltransferase
MGACSRFGNADYTALSLYVPRPPKRKPDKPKQPLQSEGHRLLSEALRARAEELGLTVRALADRWGRSSTTTHKTLRNQRRIDFMEYLDLCEALEIEDPVEFAEPFRETHRAAAKPPPSPRPRKR